MTCRFHDENHPGADSGHFPRGRSHGVGEKVYEKSGSAVVAEGTRPRGCLAMGADAWRSEAIMQLRISCLSVEPYLDRAGEWSYELVTVRKDEVS